MIYVLNLCFSCISFTHLSVNTFCQPRISKHSHKKSKHFSMPLTVFNQPVSPSRAKMCIFECTKKNQLYHTERKQFPIISKRTNCLSYQKGPIAYHTKWDQLPTIPNGTNCQPYQIPKIGYHTKCDPTAYHTQRN